MSRHFDFDKPVEIVVPADVYAQVKWERDIARETLRELYEKRVVNRCDKTAHWINHEYLLKCSRCGDVHDYEYRYCPSCGAKMDEQI